LEKRINTRRLATWFETVIHEEFTNIRSSGGLTGNSNHTRVFGDYSNSTRYLQPAGKHCRGKITCKFYAEVKRQATMSENTTHQALGTFNFKNTAVNW